MTTIEFAMECLNNAMSVKNVHADNYVSNAMLRAILCAMDVPTNNSMVRTILIQLLDKKLHEMSFNSTPVVAPKPPAVISNNDQWVKYRNNIIKALARELAYASNITNISQVKPIIGWLVGNGKSLSKNQIAICDKILETVTKHYIIVSKDGALSYTDKFVLAMDNIRRNNIVFDVAKMLWLYSCRNNNTAVVSDNILKKVIAMKINGNDYKNLTASQIDVCEDVYDVFITNYVTHADGNKWVFGDRLKAVMDKWAKTEVVSSGNDKATEKSVNK